ncbi:ELWxxDGT repeat protein [Corallococcus silvisoli]|nr:ELWxxDGT repeat protein [Corallococcus silvisoli]NBD08344.1 hypothetical protein [Corallococcus silvisoli]
MGVTPVEVQPRVPDMARSPAGLVFSSDDGVLGREPWVSNGSPGAGTRLLKELFPGPTGSNPTQFTRVGDRVFFTADDPAVGNELFVTDGTPAGTQLVKDIWPGPLGSFPNSLFAFKGMVYFSAGDVAHGRELWRSDGTAAGTILVQELTEGVEDSSPNQFAAGGDGGLYFLIDVRGTFTLLMRTDGISDAAEIFRTTTDPGFLRPLTPVGRKLFFVVGMSHGGDVSLMMTDSGATPVTLGHFGDIRALAALGGRLLFSATPEKGSSDRELWISDGTVAGTRLLEDLRPGPLGSSPDNFAVLGNRLFFSATEGTNGVELWVSDGTAAGTHRFADLEVGAGSSSPRTLTVVEDQFFFSAEVQGRGAEPWVSNGDRLGTVALTELARGPLSSNPRGFVRSGGYVFITGEDAGGVRRLFSITYRPDGTCPP